MVKDFKPFEPPSAGSTMESDPIDFVVSPGSKPILVTGSHRSGSTWTGRMLSAAPGVGYIHEPFNIETRVSANPTPFAYWFLHVCEANAGEYGAVMDRIIRYEYPFFTNLARSRTLADLARTIRDKALFLRQRRSRDRPLVKDPIAVFSAEWLQRRFNMDVLVLVRHPAAFCSSLKLKKWTFDFHHFLNQPLLMQNHLHPWAAQIREFTANERSTIEQAILLWNCIHGTIRAYQKAHPEWMFRRHEDLSADPLGQFQLLYKEFGLDFTSRVKKAVVDSSGGHNPIEQQSRNEYVRDSRQNIDNWKSRLSGAEISLIRAETAEVADAFYTEDEW